LESNTEVIKSAYGDEKRSWISDEITGDMEVGRSEAGTPRIADYLPETRRKALTEHLAERLGLIWSDPVNTAKSVGMFL
jgi:hypothetical protein